MVMYDNNTIMSLKQKKRKFEPRIKLNHNMYMYVDLTTQLPPPAATTGNETKDKKPATIESFDHWLKNTAGTDCPQRRN